MSAYVSVLFFGGMMCSKYTPMNLLWTIIPYSGLFKEKVPFREQARQERYNKDRAGIHFYDRKWEYVHE